jgi:predicted small secreted protein
LQRFNKQRLFYRFKKLRKMKKLVFMFVAIAAMSFASCGNKTNEGAANDTIDTVAADTADTVAVDTAAAE